MSWKRSRNAHINTYAPLPPSLPQPPSLVCVCVCVHIWGITLLRICEWERRREREGEKRINAFCGGIGFLFAIAIGNGLWHVAWGMLHESGAWSTRMLQQEKDHKTHCSSIYGSIKCPKKHLHFHNSTPRAALFRCFPSMRNVGVARSRLRAL